MVEKTINQADYYNRVYGGWLGRCIGSQLGAPLEFRPFFLISRKYAGLNNYVKEITGNEVNDDEMYEIVALLTLEKYGIDFNVEQLVEEWKNRLYKLNFTAERVALKNLRRKKLSPPESGTFKNPYFDFIGAQMRADIWGLICPGCPEIAAEYAKLDAIISHAGEGVLGEIFIACIIARSFFEEDLKAVIQDVLDRFIPKDSYYCSIVEDCIKWAEEYHDWRKAREKLISRWNEIRKELLKEARGFKRRITLKGPKMHEVHVLPNAGIITLGLLYGKGDFERSICTTALMGLDTDCNVGNVGTILGVKVGADQIPAKWKDPLRDTFRTAVHGFQETSIAKIAERICAIGAKVLQAKKSEVTLK